MRRPASWTSLTVLAILGLAALPVTRRILRPKPLALPAAPKRQKNLTVLWAWEAPEDLTVLDPTRTGIAAIARYIVLTPTP